MRSKHIVLYVPGLGDHRLKMRQRCLSFWHYKNISTKIVAVRWNVNEPWDTKLKGLTNTIDTYFNKGYLVSLVGESAGASAALQALEARTDSLNAVILLCGKSQYPQHVADVLYEKNPALKRAVVGSSIITGSLNETQQKKVLNLHPLFDPIVPVRETKIPGVKDSTMPIGGHILGIGFGLTVWSFRMVSFVRKQAKNKSSS